MKFFRISMGDNKGQSLVEYLILTALLAVGTMAVVRVLGSSIAGKFAQVTNVIQGRNQGGIEFERVDKNDYRKRDMSDFFRGAVSPSKNGNK